MALNLKTLATRSISGIVFVALLLGSVLFNYISFTIFFLLVAYLGLYEFYKLSQKFNAKPFKIVGFIGGLTCYVSFINFDFLFQKSMIFSNIFLFVLCCVPFMILAVALFSKNENTIQNSLFTIGGIIYAVLPFGLLHHLVFLENKVESLFTFSPYVLIGIIFLIWSNDTFAYLGGSLFGKHKLIERISPGKTWEGSVFGILMSFFVSFILAHYFTEINFNVWMFLGILVPVLATLGDLVESLIKRQAGIKDTGNIMPGHGGVLDRFDSLIFVSPFVVLLLKLSIL